MFSREQDIKFMQIAIDQAKKSFAEGGVPIGGCMVIDGKVVSQGHNRHVQNNDPLWHGEIDCIKNAKHLKPSDFKRATIYTTLSPCTMCSGAILLYKIPRVVMGENDNFIGGEDWLRREGVDVVNLNLSEAKKLMEDLLKQNPKLWKKDIAQE